MKKLLFLWASVLLALGGCTSIATTKPLGLPIWAELQGLWAMELEGEQYYFAALLPDGSLPVSHVEWDGDSKRFITEQSRLVVSTDDGAIYWNWCPPPEPGSESECRFLFFRVIETMDGTIVLFPPNADYFIEAIESNSLKGQIVSRFLPTELILTDPQELANAVHPDYFGIQFDPKFAVAVRRLSDKPGFAEPPNLKSQGVLDHTQCLPRDMVEYLSAKPQPTSLPRAGGVAGDLWYAATLSKPELCAYQECMEARGYQFSGEPSRKEVWITRNGLGLFTFEASIKQD
jgi:hypothetical protein